MQKLLKPKLLTRRKETEKKKYKDAAY